MRWRDREAGVGWRRELGGAWRWVLGLEIGFAKFKNRVVREKNRPFATRPMHAKMADWLHEGPSSDAIRQFALREKTEKARFRGFAMPIFTDSARLALG